MDNAGTPAGRRDGYHPCHASVSATSLAEQPGLDPNCVLLTLTMRMEPRMVPAGIVMSDGRFAACNLDRNGLRPHARHHQSIN